MDFKFRFLIILIFIILFILPLFLFTISSKEKKEWTRLNRRCYLLYVFFLLNFVGYITYNTAELIL